MQEIDFFRTPFFLFKSDKNFAEKISDEIGDIIKNKKKIDYMNYEKIKKDKKLEDRVLVGSLSGLDYNIHTSVGGFLDNEGLYIELENIPNKIRNHIIENTKQIPIPLKFGNIWTNITSNSDYNRSHQHKNEADLVFVLYLSKGTLWIQNPNNRVMLDACYNRVGSSISFDFNIGDMIVFPSDIHHWIEPYDGDYDRITIAGNMWIENKVWKSPDWISNINKLNKDLF